MGKETPNPAPGTGTNYDPATEPPQTKTTTPTADPAAPQTAPTQLITLTQDQLDQLLNRMMVGQVRDMAPAPSMTAGVGLSTNSQGQLVGTFQKYPVDPALYPNPVERLIEWFDTNQRTRRIAFSENYFVTWDVDSKPYETKSGVLTQEPFFHATMYANEYDDQGDPTDRAIIIQTIHFNEDQPIAMEWAIENGIEVNDKTMQHIMEEARFERVKQWALDIFFPPRNFELSVDAHEEAIGGTVVKVVTKSNVKGFGNKAPTIKDDELE